MQFVGDGPGRIRKGPTPFLGRNADFVRVGWGCAQIHVPGEAPIENDQHNADRNNGPRYLQGCVVAGRFARLNALAAPIADDEEHHQRQPSPFSSSDKLIETWSSVV